jgi:hypothetical protein
MADVNFDQEITKQTQGETMSATGIHGIEIVFLLLLGR